MPSTASSRAFADRSSPDLPIIGTAGSPGKAEIPVTVQKLENRYKSLPHQIRRVFERRNAQKPEFYGVRRFAKRNWNESPDATLPSHPGQGVTSNGESKSQKIFAFYLLRNLTECAIVFKLQFLCLFIRHASQRMPVLFFKKGGRILNDRERARKNNHLQEEK